MPPKERNSNGRSTSNAQISRAHPHFLYVRNAAAKLVGLLVADEMKVF